MPKIITKVAQIPKLQSKKRVAAYARVSSDKDAMVLFISSRIKKVSTSYIAAVGAVAVPSAVYYFIGISQLQFVSTTVPVSAISLLLNTQGALGTVLTVGAIMVILAGLCTFLVRKQQYISERCHT